jgi:hypothetical protein
MKSPSTAYTTSGKFTFAFTVLWTYLNFSQYLILWSVTRQSSPRGTTIVHTTAGIHLRGARIFGHSFLPFFLLISRHTKRNFNVVSRIAMWIVAI